MIQKVSIFLVATICASGAMHMHLFKETAHGHAQRSGESESRSRPSPYGVGCTGKPKKGCTGEQCRLHKNGCTKCDCVIEGCNEATARARSNDGCNNADGQRKTPLKCSNGFACVDMAWMMQKLCRKHHNDKALTDSEFKDCREIVNRNGSFKGVKIPCNQNVHDYQKQLNAIRKGWVFPSVSKKGDINFAYDKGRESTQHLTSAHQLGPDGQTMIATCIKQFVAGCGPVGFPCVLSKFQRCPQVCPDLQGRIGDARKNSLIEDEVENTLKDRAGVLVDARGKTTRNASVSLMSLDHTMSGKCSQ